MCFHSLYSDLYVEFEKIFKREIEYQQKLKEYEKKGYTKWDIIEIMGSEGYEIHTGNLGSVSDIIENHIEDPQYRL